MTPPAIVQRAIQRGLSMIAICDHNTAGNTLSTQKAGGKNISIIAGMEITTAEEVHVLGLFPSPEKASKAAQEVLLSLPEAGPLSSQPWEQALMDEKGALVGLEERMLVASARFTLSESVDLIKRYRGLAVAAHVDRPSFGIIGQLGIFPENVRFDALEISTAGRASGRHMMFDSLGMSLLCSSDSHFLDDIGSGCTVLEILEPTFQELTLALRGIRGRNCSCA